MAWSASTGGVTGEMIRDLMVESIERRFGSDPLPHPVQWLSDNGSCYRAAETMDFAMQLGLVPCFTPVRSPQSNGMAEAFVKTFKRDYVYVHDRPDALTVMSQLPAWFEDYNESHPHKGPPMKSPREFIRSYQPAACPVCEGATPGYPCKGSYIPPRFNLSSRIAIPILYRQIGASLSVKSKPRTSVVLLAITSLFGWQLNRTAGAAVDSLAAEVAVRKADADWAMAARTFNVDTWMSFYAVDAIVVFPNDQIASGKEFARRAVVRLLALPHLSVEWRPVEVNIPSSGDLAFLIGSYERRFEDSHGMPVSDRGRRLEVWRKQTNGTWKCIVDTWNLDSAPTMSPLAPSSRAQGVSSTAGSAPPLAQDTVPPPTGALGSEVPVPVHGTDSKYGAMPLDYEMTTRRYFSRTPKTPGVRAISGDHPAGAWIHCENHRRAIDAREA